MQTEHELRQQIVEIGRRIYEHGFVAASDGNVSARLTDGTILTTPTMVCKGRMSEDMLVLVDINGEKRRRDERNPSSEFAMHKLIYQMRPDVHAVVHAHPPFGTGFAVANVPLDKPLLSDTNKSQFIAVLHWARSSGAPSAPHNSRCYEGPLGDSTIPV